MIIIRCPYCHEQRTEAELIYGGEVDVARPAEPHKASDSEWTDYLFMRSNVKGVLSEQWCCALGCGQWFKVQRHSVTHEIGAIYRFDGPGSMAIPGEECGDDVAHALSKGD